MRRRLPHVTHFAFAVLLLLLNGVGCDQKTPSSPELLDSNNDGVGTEDELDEFLDDLIINRRRVEMTFAHVKPGEYSEVYLTFYAPDVPEGGAYRATLTGPAVAPPATQKAVPNEDGFVYFVWRVYNYGTYEARVDVKIPGKRARFVLKESVNVG